MYKERDVTDTMGRVMWAPDAALTAQAIPGRHVFLKWTREQEHMFEPYGPAMVIGWGQI
ncbi:MAG: hypothetical protein CM1200mP24_06280 [Gammaproteobacteria bacterium]|nr:MAG: hypothetical protein CM1200mP24_06280 [Gammaproteobacteria bacterium]